MFNAQTRGRARPIVTGDTEFFWQGTRDRRLLVQRCSACGVTRHPPGPACPRCRSLDWEPHELLATGRLYSYTVQHHPLPAGCDGPCTIAVVELDEGIRLVSNVIDVDPDDLQIGEILEVVFVDQDEGWTAPQFRRPTVQP